MRAFSNLPPWDRFALAHYVAAFAKGANRPVDTRAELDQLKRDYRLGEKPVEQKRIPIEQAMERIANEAGGSQ